MHKPMAVAFSEKGITRLVDFFFVFLFFGGFLGGCWRKGKVFNNVRCRSMGVVMLGK